MLLTVLSLCQPLLAADAVSVGSPALVDALKAHVARLTPWTGPEIEIRSISNLNNIVLPPGEFTYRVCQNTPPTTYRGLLLSIEASQDARRICTFWVSADIVIRARVVRAARKLPYGSMVAAADIQEETAEIADPRLEQIRRSSDAVGKILRRTLFPGDPLTRESVANPFLVRAGETVRLRLERGGVLLAVQAKAEQNGRLGELIRVRNLDFSTPVRAHVTGPGEVRVQ